MAGPCEVLTETDDETVAHVVTEAVARSAWRIEEKFSRYRADSIVTRINSSEGEPVEVDEETASLLDFSASLYRLSDGLFDVTSGVLRRAWRFDGGDRTPTAAEVDSLLTLVGWPKLRWKRPFITLRPGMQIDFGGIGKEYAVDQAVQIAAQLTDAAVLVNFGGDLAVTRSRDGNRPWRVGIESMREAGDETVHAARLVDLLAGALATSGDTYRFVRSNGERLPHILDPRNGRPVRGAPHSVTVAAPTCTNAGILTTLAMLRGAGAEEFLANEGVRHWVQRR